MRAHNGFLMCVALLGAVCSRIGEALYQYHYQQGVYVVRRLRRLWRYLARVTRKPRRSLQYMWLVTVTRPLHRFFRRMVRLAVGFPRAYAGMGADLRRNPLSLFVWLPRGVWRWLRRQREELSSLGRLLGPVAACVVMVLTIHHWANTQFCLSLSYRGAELGVIDRASVYDEGASLARDRVTNEDDSFTVDRVPTLTLVVQSGQSTMDAAEVCDAILRNSGDSIAESVGLYIDGEFVGAMEDGEELHEVLEGIKKGQTAYDEDDPDQRVEFVQDVRTEEGLFPISTVMTGDEVRKSLTHQTVVEKQYTVQSGDTFSRIALKHDMTSAELKALNPQIENTNRLQIGDKLVVQRAQSFLQVKLVKTIRYTEVIDYKTQTVYRNDKDEGYSKTTTYGKEGSRDVVAELIYVDGVETERTVVSTVITKQPVTKVVEVGTRKVAPFCWPVPVCHRVYQGYHSGHKAWDISSGGVPVLGKPLLAVDSGTVIFAQVGWNGAYGNLVKIRHANGLITVYAHMDAIHVKEGQRVTRGQQIGTVGNTGRSTGPHLHFEVIRNGVKVNPSTYFNSKDWYS
ncbi:MAG: M23 family metallopeptidase [Clostridia bacterium]|nr:M23 family metallopeptidase [Clostridia bacterium]